MAAFTLTPNAKVVLKYITRKDARVFSDGRVTFAMNEYDNIEEIPRKQIVFAFDELEDAGCIKITYKGHKEDFPFALIKVLPAGHNFDFNEKIERKEKGRITKRDLIIALISGCVCICVDYLITYLMQ